MARTLYKARGMGSSPPCAICMGPGSGPRARLHLPFGLSVWLCAEHRSREFLTRRAGRDLVVSLSGVWDAAGCMTSSRRRALHGHLARIASAPVAAPRPGSYSWPDLRGEAERRFALGEPPRAVIRELRERHSGDSATVPSVRTMQRWFTEARWLDGQAGAASPDASAGGGGPPSGAPPPPPSPGFPARPG